MYEYTDKKTLSHFSKEEIESYYSNGYVFTRLGKGVMHQVKSVRINFSNFELSSENRRVLRKSETLKLEFYKFPFKTYSWEIGKMAKNFYDIKGGEGTMSVNKLKEMFTDLGKSNMNSVFQYTIENIAIGYCLCHETENIIHYSYPFYDLKPNIPSLGMAMMLRAILWAGENNKKYIYLGSYNKYKLQFKGVEVFEDNNWKVI